MVARVFLSTILVIAIDESRLMRRIQKELLLKEEGQPGLRRPREMWQSCKRDEKATTPSDQTDATVVGGLGAPHEIPIDWPLPLPSLLSYGDVPRHLAH